MTTNSSPSERKPLLPLARLDIVPQGNNGTEAHTAAETVLIILSVLLMMTFFTILYLPRFIGPDSYYNLAARLLAIGLQTSTWTSLPAPTLFFIFTPWLVREERVVVARYMILVGYLIGAILGAGLFGEQLRDAVVELDA